MANKKDKKMARPTRTKPDTAEKKQKKNSQAVAQPSQEHPFPVVGIGASAGGLEALEQFFSKMPSDSGIAFALVPHLDPTHASLMSELLKRVTKMEVYEAEEGMKVKPDHVYVIPPNREMSIFRGALSLEAPKMIHGLRMPIDAFLRSLAEDQGEMAIGIIFSGTGTDGTLGLRAIHGAGGIVMAQDPATAKYSGMPSSAIQTSVVDYVLSPDAMPSQLITYMQKFVKGEKPPVTERRELLVRKILSLVRSQTGHDFSLYKKTTLNRRIEKRMSLHGIDDINAYVRYLQEHAEEVQALFKDLVIGVTQFFRDPEAFEVLRRRLLPKYVEGKPEGYVLRAWVPGCGTGEEAFSLAMVLTECAEEAKRDLKVQIFGTDIDENAIGHARGGLYSGNIAADVSPDRLKRFFVKENGMYRVKKEIREMVVFALQDIVTDPPFTKLDLVSCRNLLIYLEAELQNRLVPLFHYSLRPDGILFLGTSETIGKFADLFETTDKKWKLFKSKKGAPSIQEEAWGGLPWAHTSILRGVEDRKPKPMDIGTLAQGTLLETFAPPSVIVNEKGDILYVHGQTGNYLEPAQGHASLNILDMAREGIKYELRSAIRYAMTKMKEKRYQGLHIKRNGGYHSVNLVVRPLTHPKEAQGMVIVTFEEETPHKPRTGKEKKTPLQKKEKDKRAEEFEEELVYTRETLQATIEELQASNEELKSTNEELQSTNEEFQSTNEELETSREEIQSVNEELVTVNSELQGKIDQLSQAEGDMRILLDSTRIGIIFLDNRLSIKRFTTEATKIFNLIPTDIERPIHDIRTNLVHDEIEREARKVIDSLQAREFEVRTKNGAWYLMRIVPYRAASHLLDGVAIAFTETTQLKALTSFQAAGRYADSIFETVRKPMLILDDTLRVISANKNFCALFHISKQDTQGRLIYDLADGQWKIPELKKLLEEIIPRNEKVEDFRLDYHFPDHGRRRLLLNARKITHEGLEAKPMILLAVEEAAGTEKQKSRHGETETR